MDYDRTDIPAGYDRGRNLTPEVLELWMDAIGAQLDGQSNLRILDLGCGTGRFSESLAVRFAAEVIGLDPSTRMLRQATAKHRNGLVHYQLGRAEAIPLKAQSVDVVFMSMSFHHFDDPAVAASECRRVLRRPGKVLVRTGTREQIASYPYVPFFPSTRSLIEETLPDHNSLCALFEAAGFRLAASEVITQTIAPDWASYADKLAAGGDSVLARVDQNEFQAGLAAVRQQDAAAPDQHIVEPIDLFVFRT